MKDATHLLDPAEVALAVYRGAEWLHKHTQPEGIDKGSRQLIREKLLGRMLDIHRHLFRDTHSVTIENGKAKAGHLSRDEAAIIASCLEPMITTLYDRNGYLRQIGGQGLIVHPHDDEVPNDARSRVSEHQGNPRAVIADFAADFLKQHPFSYGNWMTLTVFLTELMRSPKISPLVDGHGFDLRQVDPELFSTLKMQQAAGDDEALRKTCIELVTQATRDGIKNGHASAEVEPTWEEFPRARRKVHGKRFLIYTDDNGAEFFVTVNGALLPVDEVKANLEVHLQRPEANGHPADFTVTFDPSTALWIQDTEAFKKIDSLEKPMFHKNVALFDWKNATSIDGFKVEHKKKTCTAPLVCLDLDILTGLEVSTQLNQLKGDLAKKGLKPADLTKKETYDAAIAGQDEATRMRLARAKQHLEVTLKNIDEIIEHKFHDKKATKDSPKFYMPLGGSGSGKGRTKGLARTECGENLIVNSLDGNRYYSPIMKLMVACGHHSDDYQMIRDFATLIRDRVTEKACAGKYNLFYDGSGVPYEGRFDKTVKQFKDAKYETVAVAAVAPLALPPGKQIDVPGFVPVSKRVPNRLREKSRSVPWQIVLDKHIGEAASVFAAAGDSNLDRMQIWDTSYPVGEEKILAEVRSVAQENAAAIKAPEGGAVYAVGRNNGTIRMLHVYNEEAFNRFTAKAVMNPNARGEAHLFTSVHPHVDPQVVGLNWQDKLAREKSAMLEQSL